jgi:chromate reductase
MKGDDRPETRLKILGFSGSLRRNSFNGAVLRAACELAPGEMEIATFDLSPIPLYNEDVRQKGFPSPVADFRARIRSADALLIVTPEYNYSVPGVLKNAIDWASRPPDQPFDGRPVAILGASPGRLGSARAQYHLRQVFVSLNAPVMMRPEVMISGADKLIDEAGRLHDQGTKDLIRKLLDALVAWTRRHLERERVGG